MACHENIFFFSAGGGRGGEKGSELTQNAIPAIGPGKAFPTAFKKEGEHRRAGGSVLPQKACRFRPDRGEKPCIGRRKNALARGQVARAGGRKTRVPGEGRRGDPLPFQPCGWGKTRGGAVAPAQGGVALDKGRDGGPGYELL